MRRDERRCVRKSIHNNIRGQRSVLVKMMLLDLNKAKKGENFCLVTGIKVKKDFPVGASDSGKIPHEQERIRQNLQVVLRYCSLLRPLTFDPAALLTRALPTVSASCQARPRRGGGVFTLTAD
ncbi:uncharacterized protein V6R79_001727 [Siganus canaliculatus]